MTQEAKVTWHGKEAIAAKQAGAVRGLNLGCELILGEAVDIVPLDEATLQRSGRVTVLEDELEGIVSFDTKYAVRQHEDLTLHHANGREAKYLEKPWLANREKVAEIIAFQIRKALRS